MRKAKLLAEELQQIKSDEELRQLLTSKQIDTSKVDRILDYEADLKLLQIELVKLQQWILKNKKRVVIIFEGRDAAGKGGNIRRFTEHLNPRSIRQVALNKPTDIERGQWYFRRYIKHLPNEGELVFFDRSWYNRAVVEPVMGFCTEHEYEQFIYKVPEFEHMLYEDGLTIIKFWLSICKEQMFSKTHTSYSPWVIVKTNDKMAARLECIRYVLSLFPYDSSKATKINLIPDPNVIGRYFRSSRHQND